MPHIEQDLNLLSENLLDRPAFEEKVRRILQESLPPKNGQSRHTQYQGDYGRLLNQSKSFEGGGLLPQPGGGRRLPTVTGLTLLRNEPSVGGARISVRWNDETLEVKDKIQIQVWASSDYGILTTAGSITDVSNLTLRKFSAPFIFDTSPGEFFVPASQRMVIVITAATVHSSGVISLPQFQSSISCVITPLASVVEHKAANFRVSSTQEATYIIDTSAGAVTATLPPVASFPDGFRVGFKKITTDANAMTISGAENIDGAATLSTTIGYVNYEIISDLLSNQWWLIR